MTAIHSSMTEECAQPFTLEELRIRLALINHCYGVPDPLPEHYRIYLCPEAEKFNNKLGLQAGAYVNEKEKTVTIISTGTQFNDIFKIASGIQIALQSAVPIKLVSGYYSQHYFDAYIEQAKKEGYQVVLMGHSAGAFHVTDYGATHSDIPIITFESPGFQKIFKRYHPTVEYMDNLFEYVSDRNLFNAIDNHIPGKAFFHFKMRGHLSHYEINRRNVAEQFYYESMKNLGKELADPQGRWLSSTAKAMVGSIFHNRYKLQIHTIAQWFQAAHHETSEIISTTEQLWYHSQIHGYAHFHEEYQRIRQNLPKASTWMRRVFNYFVGKMGEKLQVVEQINWGTQNASSADAQMFAARESFSGSTTDGTSGSSGESSYRGSPTLSSISEKSLVSTASY